MQRQRWAEEGVLLFLPSESRTEGGRRQASDEPDQNEAICCEPWSGGGTGFLPSPPFDGDSGTGKIGHEEQSGETNTYKSRIKPGAGLGYE
jgi:hypothetical protein